MILSETLQEEFFRAPLSLLHHPAIHTFLHPKRSPCPRHNYLPGCFLRNPYSRTDDLRPTWPAVCQRDLGMDLSAQPNFSVRLPSQVGSRSAIWRLHAFALQNAVWFLYPFLL